MEYNTISFRKYLYNKFKNEDLHLEKRNLLGRGWQGIIYKYCENNNFCVAIKKTYLDDRQTKFLKNTYSKGALKYESFIELAAMKLTNQLVLQQVCPHFVLNYRSSFKERHRPSPCIEEYPFSSKYYNEYVDNSETFTEWVKKEHLLNEWYNAYFQITVAIYSLQSYFNMTHFDLHSDNILVKTIKSGGYWEYTIDNKKYYVPNYGWIFYLNDFGHAWIPNHLQSWVARETSTTKIIKSNFDLVRLFESTLDFSKYPRDFKYIIRNKIIKNLNENNDFLNIIPNIWSNYLKKDDSNILLETFNLDKDLDTKDIPEELQHLILSWD
jgi:hypothetical protein